MSFRNYARILPFVVVLHEIVRCVSEKLISQISSRGAQSQYTENYLQSNILNNCIQKAFPRKINAV